MAKETSPLIQLLKTKGFEFDYDRIVNGNRLDIRNKPFSIKRIDQIISYFENEEEYEKCSKLFNIKKDILNHENNYVNK